MPAPTPLWLTILSAIAAGVGMVLGTAGFVMSLMNYLRDRPRVKVTLKWDLTEVNTGRKSGVVKVANVGRRPVHIGAVALQVPKGFKDTHLLLRDSIPGRTLSEGDPPAGFLVNCDGLEQYAKVWRDVRGYAEDSAGGKYLSEKLPETEVPSWAKIDR
jgi:hypothetical protein